MQISEYIRAHRCEHNLTQIQLAKLLNVQNTTISNYERGVSVPDLNTMLRISDIFNSSLASLSGDACYQLFDKFYASFADAVRDIPPCQLKFIPFQSSWAHPLFKSRAGYLVTQTLRNPENDILALTAVSGTEERIYRTSLCRGQLYLIPQSANPALTPVRVEPDKVSLQKILMVVQMPK